MKLNKQMIYVSGLPRSGSTLLCQLLGMHPDIYSLGHSSPLAGTIENLRHHMSDSPFLLGQLDVDFDLTYNRLLNSYRGFINGWNEETDKDYIVDKNRSWLPMQQTVKLLDPNYKMLVCVRDPIQLFGSIESQHQKTILIDFPDHMNPNTAWYRADQLFAPSGVAGGPIRALENMQDIAREFSTENQVYFVMFEQFVTFPVQEMSKIFSWLGLKDYQIDPDNLPVKPHETDSYYRFKFRHNTHSKINKLKGHHVPARIAQEIFRKFRWLYDYFYPKAYPDYRALKDLEKSQFAEEHTSNIPTFKESSDGQTQDESKR